MNKYAYTIINPFYFDNKAIYLFYKYIFIIID